MLLLLNNNELFKKENFQFKLSDFVVTIGNGMNGETEEVLQSCKV